MLAERLARYCHSLTFKDLQETVVHEVKRRVLDSLGCALGAWNAPPCRFARQVAQRVKIARGATLWGTGHKTLPELATFANGGLVRYFDFNDTYLAKEPAHPSDNIPAVFAVAESTGASGKRVIQAIALAYEVQCRLCDAAALRPRGWDHDVTVILYFAAWLSGCTVVPINVEEAQEKKRFILEHSEAAAVCCWHSDVEELKELQCDLPSLRQVIAVSKEGLLNTSEPGGKKVQSPSFASESLSRVGSLDDEALIVYTSGTTGPPKGVVLTVANLLTDADAIADWHGFGVNDRLMCVLPIHHGVKSK